MVRKRNQESNRLSQKRWYSVNKDKQKQRNKLNRDKKLLWYKEYKSKLKCTECGENHIAVLDFHHVDPQQKTYQLYHMIYNCFSIKRILQEINKCIVLCSNCHRKLHYLEKQNEITTIYY